MSADGVDEGDKAADPGHEGGAHTDVPRRIDAGEFGIGRGDIAGQRLDEGKLGKQSLRHRPAAHVWRLGVHRLLCGSALDCVSYRKVLGDELAAVVITDPPYNVRIEGNVSGMGKVKHLDFAMASGEMTEAQFTAFLVEALTHAAERSAPGALAYVFMDWRHMHEVIVAARRTFEKCLNVCVWVKNHGGKGSFYRSGHELIFVFRRAGAAHRNNIQYGRFGRDRTNVWKYPGVTSFGRHGEEGNLLAIHPTVKPVAMLADILLDVTVRGDIVLDPFVGSGSTIIAAEKVGRVARAIEIDPLFVDAAVRRWQRWTGEEALLEGDGRTFAQIQAERAGEAGRD
jgi:DNA modification methylase